MYVIPVFLRWRNQYFCKPLKYCTIKNVHFYKSTCVHVSSALDSAASILYTLFDAYNLTENHELHIHSPCTNMFIKFVITLKLFCLLDGKNLRGDIGPSLVSNFMILRSFSQCVWNYGLICIIIQLLKATCEMCRVNCMS